MRPEFGFELTKNKKNNDVKICRNGVILKFFGVAIFLLSRLDTGPSFMSI